MTLRRSLLVVLATAVLLAAGFLFVVGFGRAVQFLRDRASSESARQQFLARWQPPENPQPGTLFPNRVLGWSLESTTNRLAMREPDFELPGARAIYQSPALGSIEVGVTWAEDPGATAIFEQARRAFEGRDGGGLFLQVNDRLRLRSRQPDETLEVWSIRDWVFLFRGPGELPADFIRAYLDAISASHRAVPR